MKIIVVALIMAVCSGCAAFDIRPKYKKMDVIDYLNNDYEEDASYMVIQFKMKI
tara:strand:- start:1014 stop:1175 length:162 start_codon:yes stop_codon:yes gene_type:complete